MIIEIKDKIGHIFAVEPEEMAEFDLSACKEIVSTVHHGVYRVILWNGDYIEILDAAEIYHHPE